MNFNRKKIRGQNQKVRRTWMSGDYRIVWRKECFGIQVPARFQATVRIVLPNGSEMWDFAGRRLFKTLSAAKEACEKHQRLWAQAAEATGVRKLEELFGKIPFGYPIWVKSKLNRNVYGLLMDTNTRKRKDVELCDSHQCDPTRTSEPSVSITEVIPDAPIPALYAKDEAESPSSKSHRPSPRSSAQSAKEPPKARRKPATKSTKGSTEPTSKRKRTTKGSSDSVDRPSENSRKTKRPRSKS